MNSKFERRPEIVASAILADVEPGFQPGGKHVENPERLGGSEQLSHPQTFSGRQDAALYGRQGCPPLPQPATRREFARTALRTVLLGGIVVVGAALARRACDARGTCRRCSLLAECALPWRKENP